MVDDEGSDVSELKQGDLIKFGDVVIRVLWPPEDLVVSTDLNIGSMVLLVEYEEFKALLTGDLGIE